jgi:hypothetical protein
VYVSRRTLRYGEFGAVVRRFMHTRANAQKNHSYPLLDFALPPTPLRHHSPHKLPRAPSSTVSAADAPASFRATLQRAGALSLFAVVLVVVVRFPFYGTTSTHTYTRTQTNTYTRQAYTHLRAYAHIHTRSLSHKLTHNQTHTHTHTHTPIHVHTHP